MAYLRMDKNIIKKANCEEDYIKFGKSALLHADDYWEIMIKTMYIIPPYNIALNVNAAFACELYIKSIFYYKCKKNIYGHELYNLYKKLPIDIQVKIVNHFEWGNFKKENFDIELRDISEAFKILRYIYEYSGMAWNMQFVFELCAVLHEIAHEILNE